MASQTIFEVAGITAAPGTLAKGYLDSVELADGTHVRIPLILANGTQPGPTVFLGAGSHGDEINGIRAVIDAMNAIDPTKLTGRVVGVPVQNPLTFRSRQRLVTVNQLDSQNMHRVFPGSATGDIASRTAHTILADIVEAAHCDMVVDYHTGSTGSYCPPHTFVSTIGDAEVVRRSVEAANAFNAGIMIQAGGVAGVYALANMLHMVAVERGIPAFGCELGTAIPAEAHHSAIGTQGALNVLVAMGMIADVQVTTSEQIIVDGIADVRADVAGICDYLVEPGQRLEKGQPLVRFIDVFGRTRGTAISPVDGYLVTRSFYGAMNEGERVARIGFRA
ncbi:putative Succinylglutamate desuccinylase/aspartoacylase [Hyphomicrobiales bacterium]|nr:putative Succinylglutamate desuccinylase/aspartoacylase [Hyphomicrobiales bacterium]CAH1693348.1 putative Succinylglutamate desuccinylase/aspartoacylase family protein [Hyphomicrobiales bacterium]